MVQKKSKLPKNLKSGGPALTAPDKGQSRNTVFALQLQCSAPEYPRSSKLEVKTRSERFTLTALTT